MSCLCKIWKSYYEVFEATSKDELQYFVLDNPLMGKQLVQPIEDHFKRWT